MGVKNAMLPVKLPFQQFLKFLETCRRGWQTFCVEDHTRFLSVISGLNSIVKKPICVLFSVDCSHLYDTMCIQVDVSFNMLAV